MMQFTPGLILELMLVVLLGVTVVYCVVLNRKLTRLRSSQSDLRVIITDLTTATQTAERAIRGLRTTTDEAEARLAEKLNKARLLSHELSELTARPQPKTRAREEPSAAVPDELPVEPLRREARAEAVETPERPTSGGDERTAESVRFEPNDTSELDPAAWRAYALSRLKRAS